MPWLYDDELEKYKEPKREKRRRHLHNKQQRYFKYDLNERLSYYWLYDSWKQPYYYVSIEDAIAEFEHNAKIKAAHPKKPCPCCNNPRCKKSYESGRNKLTIQERRHEDDYINQLNDIDEFY